MRRVVALVLIGALIAPSVSAAQAEGKPISWQEAKKLKAGTKIVLTITGGQPVTERILFVNDSILVTRKAAPPKLAERVEKALLDSGSWWPEVFDHGATCKSGSVRVSLNGVFDGDRRVADLMDVVRHTPRADVLSVSEQAHSHVSGSKVVIVAVVVFVAIFVVRAILGPMMEGG